MKRILQFSFAYCEDPFWSWEYNNDGIATKFYNHIPDDLPLSENLKNAIKIWDAEGQATLADYPPDSCFLTDEAAEKWNKQEELLFEKIKQELEGQYKKIELKQFKAHGPLNRC